MDSEPTEITVEKLEELAQRLSEAERLRLARRLGRKRNKVQAESKTRSQAWEEIRRIREKLAREGLSFQGDEVTSWIREDRDR